MNWTRTLACVIVGSVVAAHTAQAQDVKSDQEILIDLEREWDEAFHSQNAEFIDGVLADEFIATYGDGSRGDKAKELALAREFDQQVDSSRLDNFMVKVYRDTAVVWFTCIPGRTGQGEAHRGQYNTWMSGSCAMAAGKPSPARARGSAPDSCRCPASLRLHQPPTPKGIRLGVSGARYVHTNLIARDWQRLARFYQDVFGCVPVPPERNLSGAEMEAGTGVPAARLRGMHMRLPGGRTGRTDARDLRDAQNQRQRSRDSRTGQASRTSRSPWTPSPPPASRSCLTVDRLSVMS